MNVLFTQIAALTGLFVFINQMWTYSSIEKSVFLAFISGLAVYLVLVVGDFSIRAILDFKPPKSAEPEPNTHPREPVEEGDAVHNVNA